ncbi:MAG TPA: GNAT family N-acetyltransferase [Thermoplasmata archaeon]|nr:GNAT family N-acetyltransferase [Thermoplasmata archaeon]
MAATIRELRWADLDDLIDIYLHLYEERGVTGSIGITLYHEPPTRPSEIAWFADLFRRNLEGAALTRVAEVDGHAVGSCTVSASGSGQNSEQSHVGILGILIHRAHRGHGVGRALMTDVLERCRGRYELVRLSVFSDNSRAIRLYEQLGFQRCGHSPRAIRRGNTYFDTDEMVLTL